MSAHLCPTCGRRPSERFGAQSIVDPRSNLRVFVATDACPDPTHDLADAAVELAEVLSKCKRQLDLWHEFAVEREAAYPASWSTPHESARALLAKLGVRHD